MKNFWRLTAPSEKDIEQMLGEGFLIAPEALFSKLRPRHGILLADWDETEMIGRVQAFGVVRSVHIPEQRAEVSWRPSDVTLKPNASGRHYWRSKPFFKFAKDVSNRYMLDDLFAEHFPELDDIAFGEAQGIPRTAREETSQAVPGYVYLIESEYGYKIGKTVNIKSRTRLFEVKLPFAIKLINYSWFENYSKAERDLHKRFAHKRREGEWFDLNEEDIAYIREQGKQVPVAGL